MLSVDLEGLEDEVKPKMKETSKKLRSVAVLLSDLIIPEDFKYRDKIKNMPDKIFNVEEEVKDDQKWLDTCITGFYNAEGSNKSIIDRIGNLASTTAGNFADDASSLVTKAVSNVSSAGESIMWEVFGLNENLLDKACDILDYAGDAVRDTGATVINAGKYLYNKAKPVIDIAKKVGASIANVFVGLAKGISKVLEGLLDFATLVGSAILTQFTGPIDMARMGLYYLTGNLDEYKSWTGGMWKKTMSFVSTKHVENAFSSFYKKNAIGKWLDKNAYETFKSDGQGTKIAEGIGEVIGIVGVSIFTFGGGAVASAGTATAVGIGEHTEDAWAKKKENSFEGIKEKYKNGEITEEQYNSYVAIRELTDDQWKEIVLDYQNGEISEEQFKAMQQIREMPDDWRTAENALKGIFYGTANGVWEGVQWYVGGKLGNWAIEGKKLATSAVRVGADSVFNAGDTPFRAAIDMIASDKDFKTAWEEQGGWNSVLTNFGIGLLGSAGGEVLEGVKIPKELNDNSKLFNYIDKSTVDKIKSVVMPYSETLYFDPFYFLNTKSTPTTKKFSKFISTKNADLFQNLDNKIATNAIEKMRIDYLNGKITLSREELQKYINAQIQLNSSKIQTIDDAIELTLKKQGRKPTYELVRKYRTEIKNGNYKLITREQNARDFVENYFTRQIKTIDDAIELTLQSYSDKSLTINERRIKIQEALANGDLNCITRDNGARAVVENIYNQKAKKYLALQTNTKILQIYGGFSDETNKHIIESLKLMYKELDNGKVNGNWNFLDYLMTQNLNQNIKKEIQNYARYNTWLRKLTIKEAQSTYAYTQGSGTIQKFLGTEKFIANPQRPDIDTKEKMIKTLEGIDKALEKGEILKKNQIFYRGDNYKQISFWGLPDNFDELKKRQGTVFTCQNYISTGVSKQGSFEGEIEWNFRCDAGRNYGAYVNEISKYFKYEKEYEFLVKRGARIKINKVWKEKGKTYIDASIVGFNPKKLK